MMKTRELARARIGRIKPPVFEHINRQSPPEPHTAMYVWHKYWSRKTWNVVGEHIEAYTKPHQVMFDPFAGSGVVAIEAARHKRRAIVCDLNPTASQITELTLRPVSTLKVHEAFERVRECVQRRVTELYTIHCLQCGKPLVADCFVREGDELLEVRYKGCPHCEHRCETGCKPHKEDVEGLAELERVDTKRRATFVRMRARTIRETISPSGPLWLPHFRHRLLLQRSAFCMRSSPSLPRHVPSQYPARPVGCWPGIGNRDRRLPALGDVSNAKA